MSSSTDVVTALDVALRVAAALDSLGCEYFVGGSLASSLQGEPRATNDIDLVVAMLPSPSPSPFSVGVRHLDPEPDFPESWRSLRRRS